ncbi:hypothetical protein [Domibacillus mangrovi]|uniref:Uncharacterized protein n=1 Tax=Domibacillus mangrovi TaxID=1714354 RepID=A0A1Q5P3N3_9BACI|nr:hypothetical protein [Domibacillus mangrovi]OKL36854.1 hypothetical protein BLL40_09030 [Domibacillus mangrovi]
MTNVYIQLSAELPLMFSSYLYTANGFLEIIIIYNSTMAERNQQISLDIIGQKNSSANQCLGLHYYF